MGCEFEYEAGIETPAVFQVQPYDEGPAIVQRLEWQTEPEAVRHGYRDLYGNGCQRVTLPVGRSTLRFDALVAVPDATEAIDLDAPRRPPASSPTTCSSTPCPAATSCPTCSPTRRGSCSATCQPGYRRVAAIVDHVNEHVTFTHGSSTALTTAADVYEARAGVCRDFAHVALSFCRALSIPARYVFGYLPEIEVEPMDEPMDFAAWIEVYLGGTWYTFDPRNNEARKGRVLIGRGRDALDVAMVTTFGGPVLERMEVWAHEVEPERATP